MSPPGSAQSPRTHPHITLNSGQHNLLMSEINHPPPGFARLDPSRSLIPPSRPPLPPPPRPQPPPSGPNAPYHASTVADSAEHLLPPARSRAHRFRDEESPSRSPVPSTPSSRRTSWASDNGGREDRAGPFASPFDDSRAPSRAGSDDDHVNTQTVSEKYNITPSAGLLLFPEDVEKDDWLHNPDPHEKEKRECDIFTKRGLVNVGGLAFITLGVLVLFIGYPVLWVSLFSFSFPSMALATRNANG